MGPSKRRANNLRLTSGVWAKPQIKDELNSVDKRMEIPIEGMDIRIEGILVSAQNYLVQFKVQSVVTVKCHSATLRVKVSHELCIERMCVGF